MDDEYKILETLVKKYWESAKGRGEGKVNRLTRLDPKKIYSRYHDKAGNPNRKDQLEEAVRACEDHEFVRSVYKPYSSEIEEIVLVDDRVSDIEAYLKDKYGYEPRDQKEEKQHSLVREYQGICGLCDFECKRIEQDLEMHKIRYTYQDEKDILKALTFIGKNEKDLYLREVSMEIFGSSKRFDMEDNGRLLGRVCAVIRDYLKRPCREGEMNDEILSEFHILKDKQKICLKGRGHFAVRKGDIEANVELFPDGVQIYADGETEYPFVKIDTPVFMTVENYTSWLRLDDPDVTYFYLGGFKDRTQRDFLRTVYRDNPDIKYLHFGDIDAGGFRIHRDLCESTGIPFVMYKMSTEELMDERYTCCLQPLTEEDRKRLEPFLEIPEYRDTVNYMLKHDVKLEQEIISLTEGQDKVHTGEHKTEN